MKKLLLLTAFAITALSSQAQVATTYSGTGDTGFSTSNVTPIASAKYRSPYQAVMDSKGNYWVSDQGNNFIILLNAASGKYLIRGGDEYGGYSDGAGAGNSKFAYPGGLAFGSNDTLFIADYDNHAIRRMNPFTNVSNSQMVTTIAGGGPFIGGQGREGYVNAKGQSARFRGPSMIAVSNDKTYLLVTDRDNHVIRKVSVSGSTYGEVTLYAGTPGVSGDDDGTLTTAKFNSPEGINIDPATGDVYVTDAYGGVRKISGGNVTSILTAADIDANTAAVFKDGNLYIANGCNVVLYNIASKAKKYYMGANNASPNPCSFADGDATVARFNDIATISLSYDRSYLIVTERSGRVRNLTIVGSGVGISDGGKVEDIFNVYPNPAYGYVMLHSKNENAFGQTTVRLFDVAGRMVLEQQVQFNGQPQRIEMQNAKAGIYILKTVSASGTTHTSKIIVSE